MWGMPRRSGPRSVTVLSRAGCHLCAEMVQGVRAVAGPDQPVEVVDLDDALATGALDPAEHERWTTLVPVLLVDGREVAHYRITPEEVRRALRRR